MRFPAHQLAIHGSVFVVKCDDLIEFQPKSLIDDPKKIIARNRCEIPETRVTDSRCNIVLGLFFTFFWRSLSQLSKTTLIDVKFLSIRL